jgi:2-polyprenyl-6-methoxyphenol hydroxylase-like FAD-dependent oxidoreductase
MTAPRRHAEIAGGGFAGLAAAAALAQRGWSVRVHERAPHLRPGGFGVGVHGNGARVLTALGAFEAAVAGACRFERRETRDAWNRTTSRHVFKNPMYRCARRQIIDALADVARRHGAEIVTSSPAAAAEPDGTLVLADGRRLKADLVLAADGVNSAIRDGLGLVAERHARPDGAMRLMIDRRPGEPADLSMEYWSGTRRIIYSPCNDKDIYIAMSCLDGDAAGKAAPLDVAAWKESFPGLHELIDRIDRDADWPRVQWVRFTVIRLTSWSAGRVAVLGDAAHAMTPNLGQGALCAMMNALTLAVALDETRTVAEGLALWERRERPLTEHTQRMSSVYGAVTAWPAPLRSAAFAVVSRIGWLNRLFTRAANHVPTGTAA